MFFRKITWTTFVLLLQSKFITMKVFLFYMKWMTLLLLVLIFACKSKDKNSESASGNTAQSAQNQIPLTELTKGKIRIWEGTLPCIDCSGKYIRIMLASTGNSATIASKELGKEQVAQVAQVLVSVSKLKLDNLSGKLLSFTLNGKSAFIPYLFLQDGDQSINYLLNDKQQFYKDASGKLDVNYSMLEKAQ
jgi:hypothetical protein